MYKIIEIFRDIILQDVPAIKEEKEKFEEDNQNIINIEKEDIEEVNKFEKKTKIEKNDKEYNSKQNYIKKIIKDDPENPYIFIFEFLEHLYKYLPENQESKIELDYKDLFFVYEPNWLKNFNKKYNKFPNVIYFLLDNRENFTEKKLVD